MERNYSLTFRLAILAAFCAMGMSRVESVFAHHSLSAYDLSVERVVRGTITAFDWTSPHARVEIGGLDAPVTPDAPAMPGVSETPNGPDEIERPVARGPAISFEGMHPDYLGRRGWNRLTLQPGDSVEVAYFPLRSGEPGGLLIRIRLSDGTLKVMIDND